MEEITTVVAAGAVGAGWGGTCSEGDTLHLDADWATQAHALATIHDMAHV